MDSSPRNTGIDLLGQLPWGTHMCLFYETQQDLLDVLTPYFQAGLDNHEYCLYVAAEPIDADAARRFLPAASPDFGRYQATGQMEIIPFVEWYFSGGGFDSQRVLKRWQDKLDQALALGYAGLRFVGNPYPVDSELWDRFAEYEGVVDPVVSNSRMMGLCTYSLTRCSAGAVLDVVRQHQLALARRKGLWEELAGAELTRAHEEIRKLNAGLERRVEERTALLAATNARLTQEVAERRLAEGELRFQAQLLAAVQDAIIGTDEQLVITSWNPGAEALYGWKADEVIGRASAEVLQTEFDGTTGEANRAAAFRTGEYRGEFRQQRKDGSWISVESKVRVLRDEQGRRIGLVGVNSDITQRQQAEQSIRREAARTDALLRVARAMIADLNLDRVIQAVCEETRAVMNVPMAAVSLFDEQSETFRFAGGSGIPAELIAEWKPFPRASYDQLRPKGEVIITIPDLQAGPDPDNRLIYQALNIRTTVTVSLMLDRDIMGTLVVATVGQVRAFDEDELKLLQGLADESALAIQNARLFQSVSLQRERLRVLSARLVEVQELERRHIARELHDDVGQLLTGLHLTLELFGRRIAGAPPAAVGEAQQIVAQLMDRIQDLSLDLRPAMLDDLGLVPALLSHFERYTRQTGVQVHFEQLEAGGRFASEVETALFRIVQEGLTNVARHAGVREASVSLWLDEGTLGAQIDDEGCGFDVPAALSGRASIGLSGMEERAALLGGELTIESAPGQGTQISVEIPLSGRLERRQNERNRPPG